MRDYILSQKFNYGKLADHFTTKEEVVAVTRRVQNMRNAKITEMISAYIETLYPGLGLRILTRNCLMDYLRMFEEIFKFHYTEFDIFVSMCTNVRVKLRYTTLSLKRIIERAEKSIDYMDSYIRTPEYLQLETVLDVSEDYTKIFDPDREKWVRVNSKRGEKLLAKHGDQWIKTGFCTIFPEAEEETADDEET